VMRENARAASCQRNLMDVGTAMILFDNAVGHLPGVAEPGEKGNSPLARMLGQLGVRQFGGLSRDRSKARALRPGPIPEPRVIPGFTCPSDNWVRDRSAVAPVSYRACSGGDPKGQTGAFPLGGTVSLAQVRDADGAEYTAAFAERLVGNGQPEPALNNYAVVDNVLIVKRPPPDSWKGDAGSNWSQTGWSSTLYNHALEPNGYPSLVSRDGRSAILSGSSAHTNRIHVLRLDGSLLPVTPTIDPGIWRKLATIDDSATPKNTKAIAD
ncbi:MAG TPA: DUF1559 domain-containing protein, partial [Isosphaeraceae bacterium]|nr:DUF1559 domain-containing protein [Isosphaeraceae bacterium]